MTTTTGRRGKRAVHALCSSGRLVVVITVSMLLLALNSIPTFAALYHPPLPRLETPGEGMTPFNVAVDNSLGTSSGDIYVDDLGHAVVDKFSAAGGYLPPPLTGSSSSNFALPVASAVDASGNVFVADFIRSVVDEFDSNGNWLSEISVPNGGNPFAVAINASGELFVAAFNAVYKYDPGESSPWSQFASETSFQEATGVAVDDDPTSPAYGDVYVVDQASKVVDVFDSSGKYLSALTGTPAGPFSGVFRDAVDPATGNLYVTAETRAEEFSPSGSYMTSLAAPSEPGTPLVAGVGVNATSGNVYLADLENGAVDVFGPAVIIPDVAISPATGVQPTEASLSGQVDPAGGGEVTSCEFDYGTSASYGETVSCSPSPPYASVTEVNSSVSGLSPDTVYHYQLLVGNANGLNHSVDGTFETTGPPTIGELSVSEISQASAVLHGHLDPHGFETTYHFEYGTTASYGTSVPVPDADAGSGVTETEISAEVSGLAVGTTYHYRLVATSEGKPVEGTDGTFTTKQIAAVASVSALADTYDSILRAKVEDFGAQSDCEVEYVTDTQFMSDGYSSPTVALCRPQHLAGEVGELHAITRLANLKAGTLYHYRYLISNEYGELRAADETFTTFGLAAFSFEDSDFEAHPYTQAGGHPYVLSTNIELNANTDIHGFVGPAGTVRDVRVHLPAGMIGNPQAIPQCSRYDSERQRCSGASEVGFITVDLVGNGADASTAPLFNVVPPHGVAAELSARFSKVASAFIDASVRTGSDYGVNTDSLNISTIGPVEGVQVRIWGVPADPSHDAERECTGGNPEEGYRVPPCAVNAPVHPFLRNPTSCTGTPLIAGVQADTYQAPDDFAERDTEVPAMTGCDRLHFTPTILVQPEVSAADSPTGLHVDLHIPQEESAGGLAEADLKNTVVTLPKGLVVNPASAGGLTGCSEAQIELNGPAPATCPDSSKMGTVAVVSPLVDHPLYGAVYVAQQGNGGPGQGTNKFGSLLALYVAISDPQTGVVIKQAGEVKLDPDTGQLTAKFSEIPQLPFEDLTLDFFGGQRAALAMPPTCGSYAAGSASFESWADPGSDVSLSIQPFAVTSGPGGSPCPSGAFAPEVTAGTESGQAGAFTPFALSFSRHDGEEGFRGLETTLAPGLLAKLADVPLCGSTDAAAGTCPAAAQIGTVTVAAGAGQDPISVQGQIYLTGPYSGGPFGEVVEVPAIAGPFNLGTVAVRGSIRVNPITTQATVVSDPFPTILQGVPLTLKSVTATLDRSGFTFNPTNCNQLAVTGKIVGASGGSALVSARFQVANCAKLPFKPRFTVSTQGKASKKNGASLHVKVTSGKGQANLAKVKVNLPIQLPSRLSTLRGACTVEIFDVNPAGCPTASVVGRATAVTPLLAHPLTGPAYLVSHAGAAFPDLEIVLQGEGITLILDGNTHISKGITSSTFKALPDAPISSFDLNLPEGSHSVLGAFGSLCTSRLNMPTVITGQNGAVVKQTTKITATGCPKRKTPRSHGKR